MKISDYLQKENCITDLKASTKQEAIIEIADKLYSCGKVIDKERFIHDVLRREELGSTGIGHKVAIPHSPTEGVGGFVIGFGRSIGGIDFDSIDADKVNLIFLMGTNPGELGLYLRLLAKLSKLLNDENFRRELIAAENADEAVSIFKRYEM
ncbi:MAG: PTS sugar transporter subunit IIA [Candidatus Omnitrophica bacterium]|nr:PTS sugar transporter subunit IIA [Candidatus Omnitrophota bacterium]